MFIFPLRTWRLCALAGGISKSENFRGFNLGNATIWKDVFMALKEYKPGTAFSGLVGITRSPIQGVSFKHTFDKAKAETNQRKLDPR
jgi:hypothetical protein